LIGWPIRKENLTIKFIKIEKLRKFDEEHYLADLFDAPVELEAAHHVTNLTLTESVTDASRDLTDTERHVIVSIKNKILNLDQKQTRQAYSGLVELIFSFNFAFRTFNGELEPEAAWLSGIISPMLSWLDTSGSPRESIKNCYRRSLIYPLYRSFSLSVAAHYDTVKAIGNGRNTITKLLIKIRHLFNHRDPYYILVQVHCNLVCQ